MIGHVFRVFKELGESGMCSVVNIMVMETAMKR